MNRYSRILHHIDIEDVKLKCLDEIAVREIEEKNRKFEEEYIAKQMETWGYNWRKDLVEQMTTSGAMSYTVTGEGETDIVTADPSQASSFGDATVGSETQSSGLFQCDITGDGPPAESADNFSELGTYLRFNGGASGSPRWAALNAVDSSALDALQIRAIRGNDSNGGETPDEPDEHLQVWYMLDNDTWRPLDQKPDGSTDGSVNNVIIPECESNGNCPAGTTNLRNWSVDIPDYAQAKNTRFMLYQPNHSGTDFDNYGITKVGYQRRTPKTVFTSLDSPEASAFVRVGQGSSKTTPKKRKKKVQDILAAGEKYTTTNIAPNFPGSSTKLDDPQMPDKQIADIQQTNRDVVSDRTSDLWGEKDGYSFDPPGTELPIADKNILSPEHLKRLDAPGGPSVTVNGKTYRKFGRLPIEVTGPAFKAFNAWADALYKDVRKEAKELIIAAGYGWTLGTPERNFQDSTYINFWGYDPGTPEYELGQALSKNQKDAMDLINKKGSEMRNRIVEIDSDGNPVKSDATEIDNIKDLLDDNEKDELEDYLAKANIVDPKDVKGGIMDFLLDRIASELEAGFAKDVFDYHVKWMKNPTDKPQDVTRLVRPNDMKVLTDWANRINFNARLLEDELDKADQELNFATKEMTPSLRNVIGNLDTENRSEGITKITPNYIEITKRYDFDKDWTDYLGGGGNWLVALGALGYAASKGALGGTPTMNTVIRVPLTKTKRQALSLDEPIVQSSRLNAWTSKKKKRGDKYKVTESVIVERKLKTAKEFFKQADIKPTFPENPPPELDPKTGMHPNYGKQAARYKKLDPVSARSMPKTGDPEIDAQVKKAAKKPK